MGSTFITEVVARRDAIDRLEWTIRVPTDGLGPAQQRGYALHFDGVIAFTRAALPSNIVTAPAEPRLSVRARWTNRDKACRLFFPAEASFSMATDLPGGALDAIERFRESGRLFARFEGQLYYLTKGPLITGNAPWFDDLVAMLDGGTGRSPCQDIRSEPFEMRDRWCSEILSALRPPGRLLIEITLPAQHDDGAQRAVAHLSDARRALDDGRYAEVARVGYRALDEISKLTGRVTERYGAYATARINDQIDKARSLCNPERHGSAPHHDGLEFDRPLAEHVLAVATSLVGIVLR